MPDTLERREVAEARVGARHAGPAQRVRRDARAAGLAAIDLATLAFAAVACSVGAGRAGVEVPGAGWAVLYAVGVVVSIAGRGGYRFRLQNSALDRLAHVYVSTTLTAMLLLAAQVAADVAAPAKATVRLWVFSLVLLLVSKIAVNIATLRADRRGLPTLVIGAGALGQTLARRLTERPELGLRPVGFLDKDPLGIADGDGLPVLGASWDLEEVVAAHGVRHVIVTFSRAPNEVMLGLVRRCRALGVEVSLVPRLYEEISRGVSVEHLGGIALLRVDRTDPRSWQFEVKYALDRALGGMLLVGMAPVLGVLALLVRRSSPGPVLYRQRRVGLDGAEFDVLKFRTMRPLADGEQEDWAARALGRSEEGGATPDRRTNVGRWLRRWSLDELPQLLNVARGDMSLVGPRPELPGYVEQFERHIYRYGDRHRVKSGLTGWAQVQGLRGETSLTDRIEWDNSYIENWSPWLDLKVLLLTVPAVLSGRGAA